MITTRGEIRVGRGSSAAFPGRSGAHFQVEEHTSRVAGVGAVGKLAAFGKVFDHFLAVRADA